MVDPVNSRPSLLPPTGTSGAAQAPASGFSALPSGWLTGVVAPASQAGHYSLRTSAGTFQIQAPDGLLLAPGSSVSLRIEPEGYLTLRITAQETELWLPMLPNPVAPPREAPLVSPLLLAGTPPVQGQAFAAQAAPPEAARSLFALIPQAGSGAFAIAAAVYPQLLLAGEISRLSGQQSGGSARTTALLEQIQALAAVTPARPDADREWLAWYLPFWDGRELRKTTWSYKPASEATPSEEGDHQAIVELALKQLGRVQLQCLVAAKRWFIHVVSVAPLPEPLQEELRSTLSFLAALLQIDSELQFHADEEKFLTIEGL